MKEQGGGKPSLLLRFRKSFTWLLRAFFDCSSLRALIRHEPTVDLFTSAFAFLSYRHLNFVLVMEAYVWMEVFATTQTVAGREAPVNLLGLTTVAPFA